MKIQVDLTEYEDGMLVPGRVCGRILEYPGEYVAEALRWNQDEIEDFGSEVISGSVKVPSGITLASWLEMYYPEEGRVVRKGSRVTVCIVQVIGSVREIRRCVPGAGSIMWGRRKEEGRRQKREG